MAAYATLAQIREALRSKLATALGAEVDVSAYRRSFPTPRSIQVWGTDGVEYDLANRRGLDLFQITIMAFSGSPEDEAAQTRLDTWIDGAGSTSIKLAIETDQTLGGVVRSARVVRCSGNRQYDGQNGSQILGAEFFIDVHNSNVN